MEVTLLKEETNLAVAKVAKAESKDGLGSTSHKREEF
jgi:hypothetical protein